MDSKKSKSDEMQKGQIVLPQPILDRSLIDSVTEFINEVVPSAAMISSSFDGGASAAAGSSTAASNNQKDVILWAQFQRIDHELLSWTGAAGTATAGASATGTSAATTATKTNISSPSMQSSLPSSARLARGATAATPYKTPTNRSASFDFFDSFSSYPLVLVLAYTNGLQIWAVEINGKAVEVLSWRHGNAKLVRLLPTPTINVNQTKDLDIFSQKRPLIAIHDQSLHQQIHCLHFVSLITGETVKVLKFRNAIVDIQVNKKVIAVAFNEIIMIFDSATLENKITIKTCYPSPGLTPNPISLGSRWLAFADCNLNQALCSYGGMEGDSGKSYTTTVLNAAKTISSHILGFGGTVASHIAGVSSAAYKSAPSIMSSNSAAYAQEPTSKSILSSSSSSSTLSSSPSLSPPRTTGTAQSDSSSPLSRSPASPCDNPKAGLVTIVDVNNVHNTNDKKTINDSDVVAHFVAHAEAIVQLQFDRSGQLLLCADQNGHDFNIFQIHSNTFGSQVATIHHLYVLHRGDTTARVQDICFSHDSRWVAVSTIRGTSHVFSITPYGGQVGTRTHCSKVVVNRISPYQQSAGLSTMDSRSNGPIPDNIQSLAIPYPNPRLGPLPQPVTLYPLQQIRQPISLQYLNSGIIQRTTSTGRQRLSSLSEDSSSSSDLTSTPRLTACFARSRNFPSDFGAPNLSLSQSQKSLFYNKQHERQLLQQHQQKQQQQQQQKYSESLFVFSSIGLLTQYDLVPKPSLSANKEPICDSTPIDLSVYPKARWILSRSPNDPDLKPPLAPNNILMKHLAPSSDLVSQSQRNISGNWVSQIEIYSHMEPTRRLWMGPQFVFKVCNDQMIKSLATKAFIECETVEVSLHMSRLKLSANRAELPATEDVDTSSGIDTGTEQWYGSEPGLNCESFRSSDSQLSESFDDPAPLDLECSPVNLYTDKRDESYHLNQEEKTSSTNAENKEEAVDMTANLPSLLQSSMPISKSTEVLRQKGEEGAKSGIGGTILTEETVSNSPATAVDRPSPNNLVLPVESSFVSKKSKSKLGVKISELDFSSAPKDNKNSSSVGENESLPTPVAKATTKPKTETDNDVNDEDYDNIKIELEQIVDYDDDDNCDSEKRPRNNLVKQKKPQESAAAAAAAATSTASVVATTSTEDELKLSKKRSRRNKRH